MSWDLEAERWSGLTQLESVGEGEQPKHTSVVEWVDGRDGWNGWNGMDVVVVEVILQWVAVRGAHQHQLGWMAPLDKPNGVGVESDSSDGSW